MSKAELTIDGSGALSNVFHRSAVVERVAVAEVDVEGLLEVAETSE